MTVLTREPTTTPHGLPVVAPTSTALATRRAQAVDIYTGDADDEPALEAALLVRRIARQKGLPRPVRTEPFPGRVVLSLPWPHLLQWIEMLDGLGCAEERGEHLRQTGRFYVDDEDREWMIEARVAALPHHRRGDFAIHGWIDVDDGNGGTRRQQWVLSPVNEPGCQRCVALPEPARQPLSVAAWFDDAWWRLVGKRWEEETGPRAHLVPRVSVVGDEVGRHRPSPQRRAVTS